jgi:endoplasmic reticulum chaperone BiP
LQLLEAIKETIDWLAEKAATASTEDFDEQKEQLSNVAYPITSKLYDRSDEESEVPLGHSEL